MASLSQLFISLVGSAAERAPGEEQIHRGSSATFSRHVLGFKYPAAGRFIVQELAVMETPLGLPKLEIPGSSSPLDAPALSPLVHSAATSLPHLSPVNEEQGYATGLSALDPDSIHPFLSTVVSPTYVDSQIPPAIRSHLISPSFNSRSTSDSSIELLVSGPAASPLLGQEFDYTHSHASRSVHSGIFSPRSFRTVTSRNSLTSPRLSSPSSAAALSASQLHPPLQIHALRPKARSTSVSTTAVTATPAPRPHHPLYYMSDEMVVLEVIRCNARFAVKLTPFNRSKDVCTDAAYGYWRKSPISSAAYSLDTHRLV